jgi:hypothetical protein
VSEEKKGRGRPRNELTLDDIGEKVIAELQRRLNSPRDAAEIPGTQLMQIAQRYLAYLESTLQADEDEREKLTPLEAIDKPGLALEVRYQIMQDYLQELEAEWQTAFARFNEIKAELGLEDEDDGS